MALPDKRYFTKQYSVGQEQKPSLDKNGNIKFVNAQDLMYIAHKGDFIHEVYIPNKYLPKGDFHYPSPNICQAKEFEFINSFFLDHNIMQVFFEKMPKLLDLNNHKLIKCLLYWAIAQKSDKGLKLIDYHFDSKLDYKQYWGQAFIYSVLSYNNPSILDFFVSRGCPIDKTVFNLSKKMKEEDPKYVVINFSVLEILANNMETV